MQNKSNNHKTGILFFTLMVVMLGFGLVIPILPYYVETFNAGGTALGLLMAIFSIAQFVFAPVWGGLSDRIGRKPILFIGMVGNALSLLFFALSTEMWMLYVSRALAGILSAATLPTAMAYISDTTTDEQRGQGMGLIGAAMGLGMVLGPGMGGWLSHYSLSTPFFVGAGLSALAVVFLAFFLPESLPVEKRNANAQISIPSLSQLSGALTAKEGIYYTLSFMVFFALANFEAVFGLYSEYHFHYTAGQVGTILTVIGLISTVLQGAATGPATRKWGENKIIQASVIGSAIGFILMLLAFDFTTVLLTVGFFVTSNAMLRPAITSAISRSAGDQQGMALGLSNSFMSLGRAVGPLWAGLLFDLKITYPYLSGAVLMGLIFIITMVWLKDAPIARTQVESSTPAD